MQTYLPTPDARSIFPGFLKPWHTAIRPIPTVLRATGLAVFLLSHVLVPSPAAQSGSAAPGPGTEAQASQPGHTDRADSTPGAASPGADARPPTPESGEGPEKTPFRVYDIQDRKLLGDLWSHAGRTGAPDPGRYQILAVTGPDGATDLMLMREGTQMGALPPATQTWLYERLRRDGTQGDGTTRSLGSGFWSNFWNPFDRLAPYQWRTGLTAAARVDGATFRKTTPLLGQHYDLVFTQRSLTWLTTEVGAHVSRQGGGPYRNLHDPLDAGGTRWTGYTPWWHAAVGIPGVKWEVSLSNREFPEYVWLDPRAGEGSYQAGLRRAGVPFDTAQYEDAVLIAPWRTGSGSPQPSHRNLAHSVHVKAGNLRYMAHFDRDVYRATIHQLMFEEISAPFGQWALGVIAAKGVAHSRVRFDLFPGHWNVGPSDLNARARAFFLRIHLDYHDASTYHIGLSSTFHLDAPYLRPGDTP